MCEIPIIRMYTVFKFRIFLWLQRVRFWGSIHPKSLHRILLEASNLEELSLTRYPLTQRNLFSQDQVLNLKKLIKLEILGYCCKDVSEEVSGNVIRLISQNMDSLSKVLINLTCYWKLMDSIIIAFFDFLAKHKKNITSVNASLVPWANGHELISRLPTIINQSTKDSLYSDDQQFQLESLRLSIASKYIPCWGPIIQKQHNLVDLRIRWTASFEQLEFTGMASTLLYSAVIQSASTLVHLELKELNLSIDDARMLIPFDAGILKCAQNLRRLVLVRNKDDYQRNLESYGTPTIANLDNCLPALVELEIVRFKCVTIELQALLHSSENLKSVKLHHTGTSIGHGVHGGIVELLTRKPDIKIINISPLNYHDSEQNIKLDIQKSKFQGMSHGGDRLYFDFGRYKAGIPQPQPRYEPSTTKSGAADDEEFVSGSCSSSCVDGLRKGVFMSKSFGHERKCRTESRRRAAQARSAMEQRSCRRSKSADKHHELNFFLKRDIFINRSNSRRSFKGRYRSQSVNDL